MLDDNSVGNTRNTVTFVKAYFGKKGPCWHKKDPLPFSGYNLRKDIGGKDYSRTAAAARLYAAMIPHPRRTFDLRIKSPFPTFGRS